MLPTRLNLLSNEKRGHLKQLANLQFAKSVFEICLIVLSFIAIACLGGYWVLETHVQTLLSRVENTTRRNRDKIALIENINATVKELKGIQSAYTPWTPFLAEFFEAIPPGITVQNLSLARNTKTCTISGAAKTRDDLLALQTALRSLPSVAEATIPIDQLVQQKANLTYSLTFTLK